MQDEKQTAVADNNEGIEPDSVETKPGDGSIVDALTGERDQLAMQKADLQDRYLRLQAEFDNFRRRAERERLEFAEYAGMETARALLPIVDDFERAVKAASGSGAGGELVKGVELIYGRLIDTLKKQGVEPMEAGTTFDPHLHHAVQMEPSDSAEEGAILEVYQRGYNFKGKLLRPAMVKVAAKS